MILESLESEEYYVFSSIVAIYFVEHTNDTMLACYIAIIDLKSNCKYLILSYQIFFNYYKSKKLKTHLIQL